MAKEEMEVQEVTDRDRGISLGPTSYVVLGLLELAGEATPYGLKQMVAASVGNFWSIPHSQLYSEPARLAEAGYLEERRESGGRRRKHYSLTDAGRRALREWTERPAERHWELRDPGLLKLFFGADPSRLATEQLETHRARLKLYEQQISRPGAGFEGPRLALEAGIGHEREYVRFWSRLLKNSS
jgi:PadR family transcriptional regulator, regulatory protein AphA